MIRATGKVLEDAGKDELYSFNRVIPTLSVLALKSQRSWQSPMMPALLANLSNELFGLPLYNSMLFTSMLLLNEPSRNPGEARLNLASKNLDLLRLKDTLFINDWEFIEFFSENHRDTPLLVIMALMSLAKFEGFEAFEDKILAEREGYDALVSQLETIFEESFEQRCLVLELKRKLSKTEETASSFHVIKFLKNSDNQKLSVAFYRGRQMEVIQSTEGLEKRLVKVAANN